jgi:2-polyprenyl-6-methoxyphenol hydroxylase-like FAD-dependent oxidoreductase
VNPAPGSTGADTGHAVVLGAGISGLCAARVLADFHTRVTVVERDVFPEDGATRRGVPQGAHVHSLTSRGASALEEFFPGIVAELAADGATVVNALTELDIVFFGSRLLRVPLGEVLQASRPFLEDRLRARVGAVPHISFRPGMEAVAPVTRNATTVSGVRLARPGTADSVEVLEADLVVDAMGRAGRGAAWLASLGYEKPAEDRLHVGVGYASRRYRIAPGAAGGDKGVLIGATPARPRGLVLTRQEHDTWVLSQYGFGKANHPPHAPEEFHRFAAELLPAALRDTLRHAEPLTEVAAFAYPASVRRNFHRLRRLPDGLVSIGDAVCSLNPIYGAGMTVAALEAAALRDCLAAGTDGLPRRFYRAAAKASYLSWLFSNLADRSLPYVPGTRPLLTGVLGKAFQATMRAAAVDPAVAAGVWNAVSLSGSPAELAGPRVMASVLRHGARRPRRPHRP